MFQSHVLTHLRNRISHDGLFQRLEDQPLQTKKNQTEIKLMTPVQHFNNNVIPKIKQLLEHILVPVIEDIQTNWDYSRIKCKVELVSNYIIQNGDLLQIFNSKNYTLTLHIFQKNKSNSILIINKFFVS